MTIFSRAIKAILVSSFALLAVAVSGCTGGDEFSGVWSVKDTDGAAFEITLAKDGKASATHAEHPMTGTWAKSGDSAVITWDTGWTTKISKDGDGYKKSAYGKDVALDGDPTNTSAASKVK